MAMKRFEDSEEFAAAKSAYEEKQRKVGQCTTCQYMNTLSNGEQWCTVPIPAWAVRHVPERIWVDAEECYQPNLLTGENYNACAAFVRSAEPDDDQ